jgi:hypothetical protein
LDWSYLGPKDSWEWGYNLNRHYHINELRQAYLKTGNPRYIHGIDDHLRDWVLSNPYPNRKSREDRPQWRGLEVQHRLKVWVKVFYEFNHDPGLQPGTQILMLTSIADHADYLRRFHSAGGNWITMEMNALALAAAYWPEFKEAAKWRDHALARMSEQLHHQTYPSGVQKELAMHYHMVAARNMSDLVERAETYGWQLPSESRETLERMYTYAARVSRPDGQQTANNDSAMRDISDQIIAKASRYKRDDWLYIMTNGREGRKPDYTPSVVYPWAGHVVARNNWTRDAHWSFFDVGPWGTGHQHNDKLHISLYAYGRTLLIDSGPFTYRGRTPERRYAQGTQSHNAILIDGRGQNRYEKARQEPMTGNYHVSDELVFARGTVDQGFQSIEGTAVHTRAMLYIRDKFWIVVDRIKTDRARDISALWHYHPDCTVTLQGDEVVSTDDDKGNLRIIPVGDLKWQPQIVKGSTSPFIGWHSLTLGHKTPAPSAVYRGQISDTTTFAWILLPARGDVPRLNMKSLATGNEDIRLLIDDIEVAVSLDGPVSMNVKNGERVKADAVVTRGHSKPIAVSTHAAGP